MKIAAPLLILLLLYGCCSTETVYREKQVPYTPKAIQDSLRQLAVYLEDALQTNNNCDSLLNEAINFVATDTTSLGDIWHIKSTAEKRIDSLKNVVRYYRNLVVNVQPHPDSTLVSFPVSEVRPWTFWEKIRLAGFWPMVILWLGTSILFVVVIRFVKR